MSKDTSKDEPESFPSLFLLDLPESETGLGDMNNSTDTIGKDIA